MNYQFIRIDRALTVPSTSVFSESDNGEDVYISVPGFDKPFQVGGEIAQALKAFLTGAKTFPITANGICDIFAGWVEGLEAQRALGPVNFPLVEVPAINGGLYTKQNDAVFNPENPANKPVSAVPQIDVNKIAQAIKDRKD